MALNTDSLDLEASLDQYASITDASQTGLDITGDITIEAWLKPEVTTSNAIVSKYGSSGATRSFLLYRNGSTIIFNMYNSSGSFSGTNQSHSFTNGVWKHIALTWKASTSLTTFYINGSSIGTDTGSVNDINDSGTSFAIGANNVDVTPGFFNDGLVDDVRVWDTVRTPTEISDNYQKQLTGSETNLQGYWRLNDNYLDQTSNNNDLTPVNSPVFSTDVPFPGTEDPATDNALAMCNF